MADVQVKGLEQLARMGTLLREFDDKKLKAAVSKSIREAAKPLGEEAKKAAREELPKRGGLNEFVAGARISVRTTTSGKNIGVRLNGRKSGHNLRQIDEGIVRHPVFADASQNRAGWTWVNQTVTPGWWTRAMNRAAPEVQHKVGEAIDVALADLEKRVGK